MDQVFTDENVNSTYDDEEKDTSSYVTGTCPCRYNRMITNFNLELFTSKLYYFFFWGAIGCVLPFLGVFFKQLGLSPLQCGILLGIRPLVDGIGSLLWPRLADKKRISKAILLLSLIAWAVVTVMLSFGVPDYGQCSTTANSSHYGSNPLVTFQVATTSYNTKTDSNQHSSDMVNTTHASILPTEILINEDNFTLYNYNNVAITPSNDMDEIKQQKKVKRNEPFVVKLDNNHTNREIASEDQGATMSDSLYPSINVWPQVKLFLYLLLVSSIGQLLASPAQTLSDLATLGYLDQSVDKFGLQRLWGCVGWGMATMLMSIIIENSQYELPWCQNSKIGRNYNICFYTFLAMMIIALLIATTFQFRQNQIPRDAYDLHLLDEHAFLYDRPKSMIPGLLKTFCSTRFISFFFIIWFLGCCYGVLFTFLYWYMEDLGATPLFFGIATLINQNSEILGYIFSDKLIYYLGPIRILYIALSANAIRFVYISFVQQAWIVLPVEILQGITNAMVWSASLSYVYNAAPFNQLALAVGTLQSIYHGFGIACGSFSAGIFFHYYDRAIIFRGYGLLSLGILIGFWITQRVIRWHEDRIRKEDELKSVSYDRLRLPSLEEEFEELLDDDEPITFRELSVMSTDHNEIDRNV